MLNDKEDAVNRDQFAGASLDWLSAAWITDIYRADPSGPPRGDPQMFSCWKVSLSKILYRFGIKWFPRVGSRHSIPAVDKRDLWWARVEPARAAAKIRKINESKVRWFGVSISRDKLRGIISLATSGKERFALFYKAAGRSRFGFSVTIGSRQHVFCV